VPLGWIVSWARELEIKDILNTKRIPRGMNHHVRDQRPNQHVPKPLAKPFLHLPWIKQFQLSRSPIVLVLRLQANVVREISNSR
jgi:hypothetical protein